MGDYNTIGSFRECPFCGARLPVVARFCAVCGGTLPALDTQQMPQGSPGQGGPGFYNQQSRQGGYPVYDMPGQPGFQSSQPQGGQYAQPEPAQYEPQAGQNSQPEQAQDWPFQGGFDFFSQQSDQDQGGYPVYDMPAESEHGAGAPAQTAEQVQPEQPQAEQGLFQPFGMPGQAPQDVQPEQPQAEEQPLTEQQTQPEQTQDWPFQGGFGFYNQQSDQAQGGFPAFDMTDQSI